MHKIRCGASSAADSPFGHSEHTESRNYCRQMHTVCYSQSLRTSKRIKPTVGPKCWQSAAHNLQLQAIHSQSLNLKELQGSAMPSVNPVALCHKTMVSLDSSTGYAGGLMAPLRCFSRALNLPLLPGSLDLSLMSFWKTCQRGSSLCCPVAHSAYLDWASDALALSARLAARLAALCTILATCITSNQIYRTSSNHKHMTSKHPATPCHPLLSGPTRVGSHCDCKSSYNLKKAIISSI